MEDPLLSWREINCDRSMLLHKAFGIRERSPWTATGMCL